MQQDLLQAYSGDLATTYEAGRASSPRWANEVAAMERLLAAIGPRVVLDVPFGTGRWIDAYRAVGAEAIGVDLSADMLAEARQKLESLPPAERGRFTLVQRSIFELTSADLPRRPDLVACIRFLNWVSLPDVERAVSVLSGLGASSMIAGVSVVPEEASMVARVRSRIVLALINMRRRGRPRQFVHAEAPLLRMFARQGWRVAGRERIVSNWSRRNTFYHLVRA